jgi:hypothetical protein
MWIYYLLIQGHVFKRSCKIVTRAQVMGLKHHTQTRDSADGMRCYACKQKTWWSSILLECWGKQGSSYQCKLRGGKSRMPERTPLHSTFVCMMCLTSMHGAILFMHRMVCEVVYQRCMQELHRVVRDVLGASSRAWRPVQWLAQHHSGVTITIQTRMFHAKGGSDGNYCLNRRCDCMRI